MLDFREYVAAGLSSPTFEDKRNWLEILRVEVIVNNRTAIITCRLPGNPVEIDLDTSSDGSGVG